MASGGSERAVVVATCRLIAAVHERTGLTYADEVCGPISPMSVKIIARRLGADLIEDDIGEHAQEIGIPGLMGPPVIVVNRYAEPTMRDLARRHGLAHLLAGDLDCGEGAEVRFMSSILDFTTFEERVADLFALADVFEEAHVAALYASNAPSTRIEREACRHVQALAPRWPATRVRDRARLRLALFEERTG